MIASRVVRLVVLCLVFVAGFATGASAQGVGAIAGTVTDASGAVLPGATVTLTSAQGTVGGNQEVISDERGNYQFLRLVPGTYSVKAVLQGFRPFTQAGITVNSDQTSRADARLEIGTMEEGIVVSGEAPLLDTSSALKQTVLTQEVLESLPNRMDVWSITRVIPSITVSKVDVGGSESFLQSGVTVRGTDNEGGYYIDGMDVSSLDGEGDGATMYLDPYAFAESNFLAGNNPAESPRGGLVFNMVTKTGTNQLHGGAMFSGANRGMGFDNFSDQLRSDLLATVPPSVLAANPEIKPGADINYIWDTGFWLAGPIMRDKLWFSTTYHYQKLLQYFLGSYNPDGTQTPDDHYLYTTNNKVAWQINQGNQFSYYWTLQRKVNGHRLGGSFADSRASNNNNKYPTVHQAKWTSSRSSRLLFDASTSIFQVDDRFSRQPDVQMGDIARFDTVTNYALLALGTYSNNPMFRGVFLGSVSYFTTKHDIKAGYSMNYAKRTGNVYSTSGMRAVYRDGIPDLVNTYNTPVSSVTQDREQGLYIQDKWRPTRKLTLNLGLRYEANYGWMPETCQVQTEFIAARCFGAIDGAPDWKAVESPLLGRVRPARRRLDGLEVRREPLCRPGWRASRWSHKSRARHQRQPPVAAAEPLQRSCDARLRPQRRPGSSVERARSFVGLQPRHDRSICRRLRLAECQRVHSGDSAAAARQHRDLGRLHASGEAQSARSTKHGCSDQHIPKADRHRTQQRPDRDRLQPGPGAARQDRHAVGQRPRDGQHVQRWRRDVEQTAEQSLDDDWRHQHGQERRLHRRSRSEQSEFEGVQPRHSGR